MTIEFLRKSIPKIEKTDVKGWEAQHLLAPETHNIKDTVNFQEFRKAAVMALLFPVENELHLGLIKRATYNGNHSGQIALPGGKQEPEDVSHWITAARETEEEVGVQASKIKHLKNLSPVYVPISKFEVHPFLGYVENTPLFKLQQSEVADLIQLPLKQFLALSSKQTKIKITANRHITAPAFSYNNHTIWGATAMMLNELKVLLVESMAL